VTLIAGRFNRIVKPDVLRRVQICMIDASGPKGMTVRQFLKSMISVLSLSWLWGCGKGQARPTAKQPDPELAAIAAVVPDNQVCSHYDLNALLRAMSPSQRLNMKIGLKLLPEGSKLESLGSPAEDVSDIQKEILWRSSNILSYAFKKQSEIDYHAVVKWVAEDLGVPENVCESQPTIVVERAIFQRMFSQMWDKLTPEQRRQLLDKIDPANHLTNKSTLIAMSGTAALAALAGTVYFAGFAFYTTMSVTICAVAGWFGLTLPFGAYTGASTAVGLLSGPVGWVVIGVGTLIVVGLAGRANAEKTAEAILTLHSLKAMALREVGRECPEAPL
jgi:uncharacterized protein YaaW (UPF0174 family)